MAHRLRIVLLAACCALGCVAARPHPEVQPGNPTLLRGTGGINAPEHRDKPHLVLVSIDGFKPEYLDRFHVPHIRRVASRGVRAGALIPVFPSLTFPNHYSLVTGLYPEHHGIVSNSFYDPGFDERYSLSNRRAVGEARWYRGEPIWVAAETQGMVAACFFWPGSEAPIGGIRPTFWKPYDENVPNEERVRTVLEWLRLGAERRPHLITLYFSDVDSASHRAPLASPAVETAARSLDRLIGTLVNGIDALPIRDRVYVLLTSDHGMVESTPAQEISLEPLVDMSDVQAAFGGPVANLHVRGDDARARQVRDQLNARLGHGRAYLRHEIPERFHYRADPRAGDVVVVMDESWMLVTGGRRLVRPFLGRRGMHGWDPALPSMHAMFVAAGPGIRAGSTIAEVQNVDVYPFMAEVLGLRGAREIDGREGWLHGRIMEHPAPDPPDARSEAAPPGRWKIVEPEGASPTRAPRHTGRHMSATVRHLKARVLEALERRAKQFRTREVLYPIRVPREPLPLADVVEEALGDEHGRFDPIVLRARTLLRLEWADGSMWEAWVAMLPSGLRLFCDTGADTSHVLASGGRNAGEDTDRQFLERLAESAGQDFGIEMAGGAPVHVRSSIADRAFLLDVFVTLFEETGVEASVRAALAQRGWVGTSPGGDINGADFRAEVDRWLAEALGR